jgi:hypothetical protein
MTAGQDTTVRSSSLSTTAAAICGVLGLIDIGLIGGIWYDDPPPLVVSLGGCARPHHATGAGPGPAGQPARPGRRPDGQVHLGAARHSRVFPGRTRMGHDP